MDSCRSCGAPLPPPFLSLGSTPLSNSYLSEDELHLMEPTYPLELQVCTTCFLVQTGELARPEEIFDESYPYFSSFSESWLEHCRRFASDAIGRFELTGESLVLEVASNDGYLLQFFREASIPVLGVEPARRVAEAAAARGIPTEVEFFTSAWAAAFRSSDRRADLLIANNVLAHVPRVNDFVAGLASALAPHGVLSIEHPHLLRLVSGLQFDTIYHEHFSYLSLHAVQTLLGRHGIQVFDVQELDTHGGSLRVLGQLASRGAGAGSRPRDPSVDRLLEMEETGGLLSPERFERFGEQVAAAKRRILSFLIQAKEEGKRLVGYGAPAKGNTLLNYCGVGRDFLDFTVDRNPSKRGRYLPGSRIPILEPERIFSERPDYVVILPWNLREEIQEQMAGISDWGGRFVVLVPEPRVLR